MQKIVTFLVFIAAFGALTSVASMKKQSDADIIAAITQMENDSVKADLAGDTSYMEKNYADDFTGGFSGGTWTTKQSILTDAKDKTNNKMSSETISDLKVRVYGDTAIATYKDSYDAMIRGEHRVKTVLTTDTFANQHGSWKEVASHSCVAAE